MQIEYKCVGVNGLKVLDDDEGIIETFVSVTGARDNVKDVIMPGAYEKTLKTRTPKGVWHHQWHESISRTEEVKELLPGDSELPDHLPNGEPWPRNAGALKIKTRFNLDTQRGREAYSDVKFFGDEQEWSIGYHVPVGGATIDSKTGIRKIHTLDLYEYSPVLFGAMPAARTAAGVKSAQLAYKALNSEEIESFMTETKSFLDRLEEKGAHPKDDDDEEEDETEEVTEEVEDEEEDDEEEWDDDEEKSFYLEDLDVKALTISPAQAEKVRNLIAGLQEILNTSTPEDHVEAKVELVPHVVKAFPNDDMLENDAIQYEIALIESDGKAMEQYADSLVNAVEKAISEGEEKAKFNDLLMAVLDGFDALSEKVDVIEDEEDDDEEDDDKPHDAPATEAKVMLDLTEYKDILGE